MEEKRLGKLKRTLPYSSSTLTCLFLDTTSVPSSWLVIKIKAVGENRLKIMPRIRLKLPWWVCWPLPVPRPPQSSQRGQQCHRCSSSPSTPWIHPHQAQPQRSPDVFHGGLKYIVVQHNTNFPWFHTGCFFLHWYPPKSWSMENLGLVNLRWRRSA